jgi:hypothetical protein
MNARIADALCIARRTADTRDRNILEKLGAASRAEIAARHRRDAAPVPATTDRNRRLGRVPRSLPPSRRPCARPTHA